VFHDSDVSAAAERRVDVLINNAGLLRTSRDVTTDGFEMHLAVNYLGQWLHLSVSENVLCAAVGR